jgi:integrase
MRLTELLNQYQEKYLPQIISQKRTESCLARLRRLDCTLEDLTYQKLSDYRSERLLEGVTDATVNREMSVLGSALLWGSKNNLTNLKIRLPRTKETPKAKFWSGESLSKLIASTGDLKVRAFIQLMTFTGQRKNAVLGLKWSQVGHSSINFNDEDLPMAHRMKRRGIIPIKDELRKLLRELRKAFPGSEYVIPGDNGGRFGSLDRSFAIAANKAGLKGATPHQIRHSVASILVEGGVDMKEVSMMLGHSSVAITEKQYTHLSPSYLNKAASAMGEIGKCQTA